MSKPIRIGTRKSPLALLQAEKVALQLKEKGFHSVIVPVDSAGDIDLIKPIYEMGITGVFTKNLDIALLNNTIDVAVHSLKDIPTSLPQGIVLSAVLERDYHEDVVIWNSDSKRDFNQSVIGTGSLRRIAFLKNAFPKVQCENIRGNVQTRLQRMKERGLDGVIFSLAGIERLQLELEYEQVPHMISAAGQGVIGITSRKDNFLEITKSISHLSTYRCIRIERDFLKTLEGGCTAPIGAFAFEDENNNIHFVGGICALDGSEKIALSEKCSTLEFEKEGEQLAHTLIELGAKRLLKKMNQDEKTGNS